MEPSPKEILLSLIPLYVRSVLHGKLLEALVSEQASRRTAMENATDNADEIYQKLQLDYNKERQASITQEITEVVGGSIKNRRKTYESKERQYRKDCSNCRPHY